MCGRGQRFQRLEGQARLAQGLAVLTGRRWGRRTWDELDLAKVDPAAAHCCGACRLYQELPRLVLRLAPLPLLEQVAQAAVVHLHLWAGDRQAGEAGR